MGFSAPDGGLLAAAAHGFRRPNPQPQLAWRSLVSFFHLRRRTAPSPLAALDWGSDFRSDFMHVQTCCNATTVRLFALLSPRPCGTVDPCPCPRPETGTKRDTTTLAAGASDTAAEPSLSVPSLKRKRRVRNLFSCFSPVAMAWPSC
jgi:hypothetical protein